MVGADGVEIAYDGLQDLTLTLPMRQPFTAVKAQEYPGIIIPVVSSHAHMWSNLILYITRGKAQVNGRVKARKALAQYQKV